MPTHAPLRPTITGTWGATLLPLNDDDSIDYAAFTAQLDAMIRAGLNGIYTNGTAGEFHTQTEDEFDRISALTADHCSRNRLPFQLGVSHMSAQLSLGRLKRAKALGPSAFQVILPDWIAVTPLEAEVFLRTMAEAADPIGLVLYNPGHAKKPLDLAGVSRLRAAVPGLAGLKTPDGNPSWYASMRRLLPNFSVFIPGHHLATGLLSGASGSYSNVACLSPSGARIWNEMAIRDPGTALQLEKRILAFFQSSVSPLASRGLCPAALDKALCAAGRWCPISPRLRWPYSCATAAEVVALAAYARDALPEFWQ